jgi:chaperonin GroEL
VISSVCHHADIKSILLTFYNESFEQMGWGWDAAKSEYCDLYERGIIDPAKVTINAVENSASVAGLVLTTEALVTEIPVFLTEEQKQAMFDAEGRAAGMTM